MTEETRDLTIGQALDYGCQMAIAGRHLDAVGLFKGVLMHEPENFEAIERLGSSLFELKEYEKALYWFWRGRKLNRRHPMALTNYGLAVAQLGHWEEGLIELQKAVYQAERNDRMSKEAKALCYNNLGNTLEKLKRYDEALPALDKGIAYNPRDHFPHYNRGIVLLRLNRQTEAIEALNQCLAIRPNDADALYNRSMARLLTGDLGGFVDYEARLLTSENTVINLGLPAETKLTSSDQIAGARILVHCEQGIGDDIQYLRFIAPLLSRNPAELLVVAHAATKPFFEQMAGVKVLQSGGALEGLYDRWVPLMSLPLIFGIDNEGSIPQPWAPTIEIERVVQWGEGLDLPPNRLNVGVCWAGNWMHKNDAHRSIPLETFGQLFNADGINFVSLQQIRPNEGDLFERLQAKHGNIAFTALKDFCDTAAVMLNLDLVVSVDTAVAHLSATLGVPTVILVPAFGTDWRWGLEREDSPWYSKASIYRQPKVGDWASVIARLRTELAATAAQKLAA